MRDQQSTFPIESVEKRWIDPQDLVESEYYYGDSSEGTQNFKNSIANQGAVTPVLVRVEDGELAYFEGGKRVEQARKHGKEVPFYLCDDEWTPEKVMKVQLYENTDALSSEMNMLRLAWCLEDLWNEMDTNTEKPSSTKLAAQLDISERTARRYIEPIRRCWSGTTIDRELFENGEVRRSADNDKYIINDLTVKEVDELVSYARLEDIRKISDPINDLAATRELERFSDTELRKKLLSMYIRNQRSETSEGISGDELRRIKKKIKNEEMMPPKAISEVINSAPTKCEPTLEGDTAKLIEATADKKNISPTDLITNAAKNYIEQEGYADSLQEDYDVSESTDEEYIDQLDYLDHHVEEPRSQPDLRMKDNSGLSEVPPESIALTVTSPPYNLDKDYGDEIDDDRDYFEGYLAEVIAETVTDIYHATIPGGFLCLNVPIVVNSQNTRIPKNQYVSCDVKRVLADRWSPMEHAAFDRLTEQTDWQFHHPVFWEKGYSEAAFSPQEGWPSPPQEDLNTTCEAVLVFQKPGEREISKPTRQQSRVYWKNDAADSDLRDMKWSIPPSQWEPEYAESYVPTFPEELVRRCIILWSYVGDTVLDPFCGRGTTLKMAKRLYRESIGYEIQEELEQDIREYVGL